MNTLIVRIEILLRMRVARFHAHELERPHDPLAPEAEMIFDPYLPIENPAADPSAASSS